MDRSVREHQRLTTPTAAPAYAGATILLFSLCPHQRPQPIILILIPDLPLQTLARRGVRQLVDEDDLVGKPPFGDLVLEVIDDRPVASLRPGSLPATPDP